MYATLEKPSNLANKINFKQKQDVPAGLKSSVGSSFGHWPKVKNFFSSAMKAKIAPPESTTFWPPQWCVLVVNKSTDSAKPHLIY